MTAKNYSTAVNDFVEAYGKNARRAIKAYRAGADKVAEVAHKRFEAALAKSRSELSEETVANARNTRKAIGRVYSKSVDITASGAEAVVNATVKIGGELARKIPAHQAASAFRKARARRAS